MPPAPGSEGGRLSGASPRGETRRCKATGAPTAPNPWRARRADDEPRYARSVRADGRRRGCLYPPPALAPVHQVKQRLPISQIHAREDPSARLRLPLEAILGLGLRIRQAGAQKVVHEFAHSRPALSGVTLKVAEKGVVKLNGSSHTQKHIMQAYLWQHSMGPALFLHALRCSLNVRHQDRREMHKGDTRFAPHVRLGHLQGFVHAASGLPTQRLRGSLRLGADHNHFADVGAAVLTPVPHVERVYAVIGVAGAVQADVVGVAREFGLVFALQLEGVARFGQQTMEELD